MIHELHLELERDPSMLWKYDLNNFFNEIKRVELFRSDASLLGDSFGFHVACLLEKIFSTSCTVKMVRHIRT